MLNMINIFQIKSKIGYFTLNNANNNDIAMEIISVKLRFEGVSCRGKYLGHIFNLSAKDLLFSHNVKPFKVLIYSEKTFIKAKYEL